MKKLSAILVGMSLVAGVSMAAAVTSVNAVGYANKTLEPATPMLITCNFQKVGGGTNTLLDVFGVNQLAQNDSLAYCDLVLMWDTALMKYQTYAQWTDGVIYKANTGAEWDAAIVANPEIPVGSAMWIIPSGAQVTNKTLTLAGEVVAVSTQNLNIVAGPQLIGYPLTSSVSLTNTGFAASGAARNDSLAYCDLVVIWLGDHYQTYALWTDGVWYKANDGAEWDAGIVASNIIQIGDGFWYIAVNPLTLTEVSPYANNLK